MSERSAMLKFSLKVSFKNRTQLHKLQCFVGKIHTTKQRRTSYTLVRSSVRPVLSRAPIMSIGPCRCYFGFARSLRLMHAMRQIIKLSCIVRVCVYFYLFSCYQHLRQIDYIIDSTILYDCCVSGARQLCLSKKIQHSYTVANSSSTRRSVSACASRSM